MKTTFSARRAAWLLSAAPALLATSAFAQQADDPVASEKLPGRKRQSHLTTHLCVTCRSVRAGGNVTAYGS